MRRKVLIPIIIFSILLLLLIVAYSSIVSSKTIKAQLNVEKEKVYVNELEVSGNVKLREGDMIKTSAEGLATVILYESILVILEPDTEILIDNLAESNSVVFQKKGETWNQLTRLLGIEDYTIKTGNSVASVRGTGFGISENKIIVGEGKVRYTIDGEEFLVLEGKAVEKLLDELTYRDLTESEKQKIIAVRERIIQQLKILRQMEIEKHKKIVGLVKKTYKITDEDIQKAFEDADEGRLDLKEMRDKSPLNLKSLEKIIQITELIQKIKNY
ncbi:MAG: hypothetical protein ABH804_00550 [archaeon]